MKKINNYEKDSLEIEKIRRSNIKFQIKNIESKSWYGVVLIYIVIGLILILAITNTAMFGTSIQVLGLSFLMICFHVVLLFLSKIDKSMAFIGGLIAYIIYYILYTIITNIFMLISIFWSIAIIGSYLMFIYDELKLKKLNEELSNLNRFQ